MHLFKDNTLWSRTYLRRILSLEQKVDLSKFQIDTFPLIDADNNREEVIQKVKGIKGETDNEDFDEEVKCFT
jgi:hypothetical protein